MNYNFKELFSSLKGNLLILVLSMFMWTFTQQMIQTYEPLYIFSLGGTGTVLGLILQSPHSLISSTFSQRIGLGSLLAHHWPRLQAFLDRP